MKIYFPYYKSWDYTYVVLGYLAKINKHEIVTRKGDPFDLIAVSLNDVADLSRLVMTRKAFPDAKIIAGGCMAICPEMMLPWADWVNVGEGFELFAALGKCDLETLPFIATKNKPRAVPSYVINWGQVPMANTSKSLHYYLLSRGCRNKCLFCLTSWSNPHTTNPLVTPAFLDRFANKKITFVTNDIDSPLGKNVQSTTVKHYLEGDINARYLHIGIEGFSEARRSFFGKPIRDVDIQETFAKLKMKRQEGQFFFIAGLPGTQAEAEDYATRVLPMDTDLKPRVNFKITYFDPTPGTPLETWDLRQYEAFDFKKFRMQFWNRNRRARYFYCPGTGEDRLVRPAWRAAMRRATITQAPAAYACRNEKSFKTLLRRLEAISENLLTGEDLSHICPTSWHDQKEAAKKVAIKRLREYPLTLQQHGIMLSTDADPTAAK